MEKEILEKLKNLIISGDAEGTKKTVEEALSSGLDPLTIIKKGLTEGIREVGEKFARLEIFLTGMILSAEAFGTAMEILEPKLLPKDQTEVEAGTVVIGAMQGDIHDIGKNLVSVMLKCAGFRVYDLGTDVPVKKFIDKAEEVNADIIAGSALLTSTMIFQQDLIKMLKDKGLRDKYKVLVGGGPVTAEWMEKIGADGYGRNATEAAIIAKKILGLKQA